MVIAGGVGLSEATWCQTWGRGLLRFEAGVQLTRLLRCDVGRVLYPAHWNSLFHTNKTIENDDGEKQSTLDMYVLTYATTSSRFPSPPPFSSPPSPTLRLLLFCILLLFLSHPLSAASLLPHRPTSVCISDDSARLADLRHSRVFLRLCSRQAPSQGIRAEPDARMQSQFPRQRKLSRGRRPRVLVRRGAQVRAARCVCCERDRSRELAGDSARRARRAVRCS
eukprot:1355454-Rhodomonas_salina.2